MNRLSMSTAAAALLRAFLARASVGRDRILLTHGRSIDWQSLIFIGERHEFGFRISDPDAAQLFDALTQGLEDAEFAVPGHVVADIALQGPRTQSSDGSISFEIEALTIAD